MAAEAAATAAGVAADSSSLPPRASTSLPTSPLPNAPPPPGVLSTAPLPLQMACSYMMKSALATLALALTAPSPSAGAASGSQARSPLTPGSGGGKPGSPSPNQGHNKRRFHTNNGGYQGTAASTTPWTRQVYAYPMALPPPP
ncbi:hypothetical protein ZWY2020_001672 [Hordeum vulgare]|nr:hypothetical protein ZWY2020_001672 [Hordeum vulgare]